MSHFNPTDPKEISPSFFRGALNINYATATCANIAMQNFNILPRHWYIDVQLRCGACATEFLWSAREQKVWFETYRFYVESQPKLCRSCRATRRHVAELQREYDALVQAAREKGTTPQKQRVIEIVDELDHSLHELPDKMLKTRDLFRSQVAK